MKECIFLFGKRIHKNIRPTVVVVIGKLYSHAGERVSVLVVRHADSGCNFFEFTVLEIVKQLLSYGVIRNKDIGPAVAVIVVKGNSQTLAGKLGNAALLEAS